MTYKRFFSLICVTGLLMSCQLTPDDESKAQDAVEKWAAAYFSCDFHDAARYCTPESERWLRFAASNTTQHDLDLLSAHPANINVEDCYAAGGDTLYVVRLSIENYLKPTTLGDTTTLADGLFDFIAVRRDGQWLVRMEGLPRSEKQSRD